MGDQRQPALDPLRPIAPEWVGAVRRRSAVAGARARSVLVAARDLLPAGFVHSKAALAVHSGRGSDACRGPSRDRTGLLRAMVDDGDRVRELARRRGLASERGRADPATEGGFKVTADQGVVLYDQDCGFCKWSLAKVLRWDHSKRLRAVPIQSEEGARLLADVPPDQRLESWHFVDRDGKRFSAGAAAAPLARALPRGRALA